MFENSHFYEHVPKSYMFVSLQDAVAQAQYEQQQDIRFGGSVEPVPSKIMVCLLNTHFSTQCLLPKWKLKVKFEIFTVCGKNKGMLHFTL